MKTTDRVARAAIMVIMWIMSDAARGAAAGG